MDRLIVLVIELLSTVSARHQRPCLGSTLLRCHVSSVSTVYAVLYLLIGPPTDSPLLGLVYRGCRDRPVRPPITQTKTTSYHPCLPLGPHPRSPQRLPVPCAPNFSGLEAEKPFQKLRIEGFSPAFPNLLRQAFPFTLAFVRDSTNLSTVGSKSSQQSAFHQNCLRFCFQATRSQALQLCKDRQTRSHRLR